MLLFFFFFFASIAWPSYIQAILCHCFFFFLHCMTFIYTGDTLSLFFFFLHCMTFIYTGNTLSLFSFILKKKIFYSSVNILTSSYKQWNSSQNKKKRLILITISLFTCTMFLFGNKRFCLGEFEVSILTLISREWLCWHRQEKDKHTSTFLGYGLILTRGREK